MTVQNSSASISFERVDSFFKKKVTKFGNGAKIDCPKEFLGKTVYVVVSNENEDSQNKNKISAKNKGALK